MNGDTDGKVYRGAPLNISARTWNALMDVLRDWRKSRPGRGAPGGTFNVDPRLTVLIRNTTGTAQRALSVFAIGDLVGTATGRKLDANARPAFDGGIPTSADVPIAICQEPATATDAQGARVVRGAVAGVTLCRVLLTDLTHEWANPVAGVTAYLQSSANQGQARILWSGTSDVSGDTAAGIKLCAILLIGSKPTDSPDESGYGDSGAVCDKYRVRCSDGWLISEVCNDANEWEFSEDLGVYCARSTFSGESGDSGEGSAPDGFNDDFDTGPLEIEVVTKVCPIEGTVSVPAGEQGPQGEPGADGAPGAPGAGFSAGFIADFAGTSVPSGWLQCDGSGVSRSTYATLFGVIGTTWGAGDGSTTFNLPDLRRRTRVGSGGTGTGTLGNTVGNTGGAETHTLTVAEMPSHAHRQQMTTSNVGPAFGPGRTVDESAVIDSGYDTQSTGGSGAHNNIQPSAVVLTCIKT